jgi:hypothetical protein
MPWTSWKDWKEQSVSEVERLARERLAEDEAAMTGGRKAKVTLGRTAREFWQHPSPWMLLAVLATVATWRVVEANWQWGDLWAPVILVALFPVLEWLIHVFVLHWRPRKVAGVLLDYQLARDHRRHHADPRRIPLVFIPWQSLVWVILAYVTISLLAFPRLGQALTFLFAVALTGLVYEWTHYLIHSDYKPKSAAYKAVWRNHRLHHYKNEHYWFSVTTSGTSDRLFGTYPDPGTVTTSPTAKNLHGAA